MAEDSTYRPERTVGEDEVLRTDEGLYGKVYILSLVEFYEAIGGRHGRLAESLLIVCDTVFNEHTGPNDGYSLVGEDQYVFRFGGLDDRAALMKAAKIIEEIGTKMLGEHFVKSGKFKAMLTAVGLADIVDGDGNMSAEKVAHAAELARNLPPEPSRPDEPMWVSLNYAGLDAQDNWIAVQRAKRDDLQWVALEHTSKKKELQWEALRPDKKKDEFQWEALKPDKKKEEVKWEVLKPDKKKEEVKWEVMDHKKKDSGLDWAPLVKRQTERRTMVMQDGVREFHERRQVPDRRSRQDLYMGHIDRRSQSDRRRGDRRTA